MAVKIPDDDASVTDEVKKAADRRKIAEDDLATEEARLAKERLLKTSPLELLKSQQSALGQLLPKGETKPLEGKIDTSGDYGYISEIAAHCALDALTTEMANDLCAKMKADMQVITHTSDPAVQVPRELLIIDRQDYISSDLSFYEIDTQFNVFQKEINDQVTLCKGLLEPAAFPEKGPKVSELGFTGAVAAIGSVAGLAVSAVSQLADFASYFKADYTLAGMKFEIKREALLFSLLGKIVDDIKVVSIEDLHPLGDVNLVTRCINLQQIAYELRRMINKLDELQSDPIEVVNLANSSSEIELKNKIKSAKQNAEILLVNFDTYVKSVTAVPENARLSRLALACIRDKIRQIKPDYLLFIDILSSGGAVVTRKSLFRSSAGFLGGVIASYVLINFNGKVIAANTLTKLIQKGYRLSDFSLRGLLTNQTDDGYKTILGSHSAYDK